MKMFLVKVSAVVFAIVLVILVLNKPNFNNGSSKNQTFTEVTSVPVSNQTVPTPPEVKTKHILNLTVDHEQVIVLAGEIAENAATVASEISEKGTLGKPLYLLINSPGGSVLDGALIIDAIEASKVPVNTVCMQLCASMAAITHQYGAKRMMLDRSILMFHDAAGGFQGYFPHVKSQFEMINRYVTRFNAYIAHRAGNKLLELELNEHIQYWRDAEDSMDEHLVDQLVYINVLDNKKQVDIKTLLGVKPKPTNTTVPQTVPYFFDVQL